MQFGQTFPKQMHYDSGLQRMDSSSKRLPPNRIKVISKMPTLNSTESNTKIEEYTARDANSQSIKKTSLTTEHALRKMHSCQEPTTKEQYERNLLRLMQEQLQLAKKLWEDRMKDVLKENSIQISKLQIKISNNNELLKLKDIQIETLKRTAQQDNKSLMTKRTGQFNCDHFFKRVIDLEGRANFLAGELNRLNIKTKEFQGKVERVEKSLLRIMACKMSNLQLKIDKFAEASNVKLTRLDQNISTISKKKQVIHNSPSSKASEMDLLDVKRNMESLKYWVDSLKEDVHIFRDKKFQYQNSDIIKLQQKIAYLKHSLSNNNEQQSSIFLKNQTPVKSIRRKPIYNQIDSITKSHNFQSSFFDDYKEEAFEQLDSIGEDQFFHPLEQSAKKFIIQHKSSPSRSIRPKQALDHSRMNDSFENFSSDDEEEQYSPSELRFIEALKYHQYPQPLYIEIDQNGLIKMKSKGIHLRDSEQKCFKLSNLELNRLKLKKVIIW